MILTTDIISYIGIVGDAKNFIFHPSFQMSLCRFSLLVDLRKLLVLRSGGIGENVAEEITTAWLEENREQM